jgi:superfamily II DNA or RNA helicase
MTAPHLDSSLIPQADRILRVIELVRAIAAGSPLDLDARDSAYYRQASRVLGFLDTNGAPTPAGLELISSPRPKACLRTAFQHSAVGRAWMAYQGATSIEQLDPQQAVPFLQTRTGMSQATVSRRASTLRAWVHDLTPTAEEPAETTSIDMDEADQASSSLTTLCSDPLSDDELDLAEALLDALREGDDDERAGALADVLLAAHIRVLDGLDHAREAVTWLNTSTQWHFMVPEDLLNRAVRRLEDQGYHVQRDQLPPMVDAEHPTLVIEFEDDANGEDAEAFRRLVQQFGGEDHRLLPAAEATINGTQSRLTMIWARVSMATRPSAPLRVRWLRRSSKPHVLPLVTHGPDLHLTTLHHIAALARICGEPRRMELLGPTGSLVRWGAIQAEDHNPAYRVPPGVLIDKPSAPGQTPWLWWAAAAQAPPSHTPVPGPLEAALELEPGGGPAVLEAMQAYGTDLPPLEFGPPTADTTYEAAPPEGAHMVIAPTGEAIRLHLPEAAPATIRRDFVLHALGHILLGHIHPESDHALWDTAATIRLGPDTRPLDRPVQQTYADWFPKKAQLQAPPPPEPNPPEPEPVAEPSKDNQTFLLLLRALLAREPWHLDPYFGLRGSDVDPLPHQVQAVYQHLLPQRPLRLLLADDPGAGKTIMAGLLIRERLLRGTLRRCLIVAPGGLVDQWQAELEDRFDLHFEQLETAATVPFSGPDRLVIARLDQLARNRKLKDKLQSDGRWDLVVVDEAHKLSAAPNGRGVDRTARYRLGELLREQADDLLMMTATPHNGIEGCFQLSLALIDPDRFCGPYQEPFPKQQTHDVLLRRVKEDLVRFDDTKLFPERFATTVAFALGPDEQQLYEALTDYVRDEMNRVADADTQTANRVGFAMQVLQRRLASSPKAIHVSLERRRKKLEQKRSRQQLHQQLDSLADTEDLTTKELEAFEDQAAESTSTARTTADLEREILVVKRLERMARGLLNNGIDSKWKKLRELLDSPPLLEGNLRHKLVVFTESRDTLSHLTQRLRNHLGRTEAVTEIHGGLSRKQRRQAVEAFMTHPGLKILVANDAAGEGVNLQGAHFLVNYDLPWNPNRLEQRFGRIHRIGQAHTCRFYNLLASGTREGDVYIRLLEKLEVEREALGGRVYDVLGELFEGMPLSQILKQATMDDAGASQVERQVTKESLERLLERGTRLATRPSETPSVLDRHLRATEVGDFLALDDLVPELLVSLGGRMRRSEDTWADVRLPGKVQRLRDASGNRLPRRYDSVPCPLPRAHAIVPATIEAFVAEHHTLATGHAVLECDVALPGPVPAMLVEVTGADGEQHRVLRLAGWSAGALVDLDSHATEMRPSNTTQTIDEAIHQAALERVREHLARDTASRHEARLPELKRRHAATIDRLERAIEEQAAHADLLATQRAQDAHAAREELRALRRRKRAVTAAFAERCQAPVVNVRPLAHFTLLPRASAQAVPTPHEVQQEALDALAQARAEGKRAGMVVMATGLGKTWLSAFDFAAMGGKRALFLAHRDEILTQAAESWGRLLPAKRAGFFDASHKDTDADLIFASVQALSRRKHLARFPADHFDYIVVDEFHHAAAASYRRVIHHFSPTFLLGMTATPDRTDGASLLALCEGNEIHRASLVEGISRQLLAPFHYYGLVSELDYDMLNWRAGRFDLDQLTELAEPWTEQAWSRFLEHAGPAPRRTLVFCCTTRHADYVAHFLRNRGIAAAAVHSKPSSAPRKKSLQALRDGRLEAICCVDVFNEGVDLPQVDHVLMLRPTESPIVFLQQLGRGLRTAPGKKALTVVDFIGNHRSFLLKPAVLLQLTGESPNPSASVQRLKKRAVSLPPGCVMEVETAAIDLLEQLARRSPQDVLLFEYARFWEAHGRRPSAGELFAAGANLKPVADNHGNWFDFLAEQGDLDEAEQRVLQLHRGWLDALWALRDANASELPSSFPLLALQVMLDEGTLFDRLAVEDVVAGAQLLAEADPLLQGEPTGGVEALRFWWDAGPADRRQVEIDGDAWIGHLVPDEADAEALTAMTGELLDLVLRRRRHNARLSVLKGGDSWLLKVSHNSSGPMLWLHRDKNPGLPEPGTIALEADGQLYEADVVKVALNVIRPRGGGDNMLRELMYAWFGPLAGSTGSRHFVRLERRGTYYRMGPAEGVGPMAPWIRAESTQLAFFPDQAAACGLDVTVNLVQAAPVRIPVPGEYDPQRHFLIRALGDSMDGGARPIRDGDLVLCRWLGSQEREPAGVSGPCMLVGKNGGDPMIAIKTPVRRDDRWWLLSANPAVPDEPIRPGMRLTPVAQVIGPVQADLRPLLWHSYPREAIAALFGDVYNKGRWNQGHVDLDSLGYCATAFFISLRKREDTLEEHRYGDAFESRDVLRIDSQASTGPDTKKGRRIIGHEVEGRVLHTFVRTQSRDPFVYCGTTRYLNHEGSMPMQIRLGLPQALPERLWALWRR